VNRVVDRLLAGAAGLFLALLLWACLTYWPSACFADHFEVHVACVAHRVWSGHPIYNALDAADRYSTVLGPNTYLWNALLQGPRPTTITDAKTPGLIAAWLALGVLGAALWRRFGGRAAFIGCGFVAMYGQVFDHFLYWNRGDPLVVLCLALGVAGVLASNVILGAVLFGAAAGLALGVKFHAVILFLPLLPWFERRIAAWKPLVAGAGAAAATAIAPFLLPQSSLANHLKWLAALSAGPAVGHDLGWAAMHLALLSLPIIALSLATNERRRLRLVCWFIPVMFVLAGAAFVGLEQHHVMPLAAPVALIIVEWLGRKRTVVGSAIIAMFVLAAGGLAVQAWMEFHNHRDRPEICETVQDDFEMVLRRTVGLRRAVGYDGLVSYAGTQVRTLLVFRDETPLYLDGPALMDHRKASIPLPAATIDAIRRRDVDLWVIPKGGEPWNLRHFYRRDWSVFPDEFKRAFGENYQLVGDSQFFSLWLARGKQLPGAGSTAADSRGAR
jgi:hypothetical protein